MPEPTDPCAGCNLPRDQHLDQNPDLDPDLVSSFEHPFVEQPDPGPDQLTVAELKRRLGHYPNDSLVVFDVSVVTWPDDPRHRDYVPAAYVYGTTGPYGTWDEPRNCVISARPKP